MSNTPLTKKAAEFVTELFKNKLSEKIVYHNIDHTFEVADTCKKLASIYKLNNSEMEIVLLACWFHDTGYIEKREGHELISAGIAEKFLGAQNFPKEKIEKVKSCILATSIPQNPKDILEEIVCDSDLSHFGKKNFFNRSNLLRLEFEQVNETIYSDFEWIKKGLDIMFANPFHTKAAKDEFGEQRTENLLMLQKKLRKKSIVQDTESSAFEMQKEKFELKKEKQQKPERGIETMFRLTSSNHLRLSSMADEKAHIMINVNTILISLVITILVRKLDSNPHLIIPTFLLLSVSLLTIVFATLATKPKVTSGTFTTDDIKEKRVNLLFFGNFFKMKLDDFEWGMKSMMNDRDFLYGSMIKDFYYLGKVLGQKYKHLRICYNIFMYGMILAILAFAIAIIFAPYQTTINIID
ncbi:MAG: DUF5706 domain-containing protein [Ignavibacteriales bacterium]|nr:DUF5706 domain-containing protein [Ignavibacteriales bacterium]